MNDLTVCFSEPTLEMRHPQDKVESDECLIVIKDIPKILTIKKEQEMRTVNRNMWKLSWARKDGRIYNT